MAGERPVKTVAALPLATLTRSIQVEPPVRLNSMTPEVDPELGASACKDSASDDCPVALSSVGGSCDAFNTESTSVVMAENVAEPDVSVYVTVTLTSCEPAEGWLRHDERVVMLVA
ncbi:MAG: hypothetical protein ACLSVD_08350 [Eggerthellaceae bacterium]